MKSTSHKSANAGPKQSSKSSAPSAFQASTSLLVGVALVAFALGGVVVGVTVLWKATAVRPAPPVDLRKAPTHAPIERTPSQPSQPSPQSTTPSPRRNDSPDASSPLPSPQSKKPSASSPEPQKKTPPPRIPPNHRRLPRSQTPPSSNSNAQTAGGSGGGMTWGAPNWVFDPAAGLLGQLRLIALQDVVRILKFAKLRPTVLQGIARSTIYDAIHFKPTVELPNAAGYRYGLGVQLWLQPEAAPIQMRWKRYRYGYPNVKPVPKPKRIGRDSFFATRNPIRYLLFLPTAPERHALLILSCHRSLCTQTQLLTLAKLLDLRIQ